MEANNIVSKILCGQSWARHFKEIQDSIKNEGKNHHNDKWPGAISFSGKATLFQKKIYDGNGTYLLINLWGTKADIDDSQFGLEIQAPVQDSGDGES